MDNFTNQDNNMQNTAGGNTYSYDYMNNAANTNGAYSQPQTAAPDYTQSQTVAQDYTQPGTYTGATAAWQAQKQAQQQANAYNQSYQAQYNAPVGGYAPAQPKKPLIGLAIASMVLGILSILCCCFIGYWSLILSLTGIVLGIIALVKDYAGKGMAVAGVICSGISIVLILILIIISFTGSAMLEDLMNDIYREIGYEYGYRY